MMVALASFVISLICYGVIHLSVWHFRRRRLYELALKFEGPPTLPFLGNAHLFIGDSEHIVSQLLRMNRFYSSPCQMWLGPLLVLVVDDPGQMKVICLSPKTLEKGNVFVDMSRPFLGSGLLTSPVSIWKVHRKLIQPTFNAKILDSFVGIMATQSKILTDQMSQHSDGSEFEIFKMVSSCTLDMIYETSMGIEPRAQTGRSYSYVEATEGAASIISKRIFSVWLHPDLIFYFTQSGRDQRKYLKFILNSTDSVIQEKRDALLKCNSGPGTPGEDEDDGHFSIGGSTSRKKVFLDHLLTVPKDSVQLSDQLLRDEVITMVVAGHHTTAFANSYTMMMLASHPDVQARVYEELYEIYGDDDVEDRPVAPKDLPRMKYLERVIKETLRLFPVVPFIIREVVEDLDIGDRILPSGSSALISIHGLHRNEKHWPDPLKFDPDRFLPEEVAKRHPDAFMAFSSGPRNCIGLTYALMSMKTLMATVLRRYILKKDNIQPIEKIRLKMEILLHPVDPFKIRIERRTDRQT